MRLGKYEMEILRILVNGERSVPFRKVREDITGHQSLKWGKLPYDKHYEVDRLFKTLSRATKTLEEKGLIKRDGYVGYGGRISRIWRLELTEEGRNQYIKRVS